MAADTIRALLEAAFPGGQVDVLDRTGGGDHFHVTVASDAFDGVSLVEQHRMVNRALAAPLADGTIHELHDEGTRMTLRDQIQHVIDDEPVAIFMKGTPERPACGNSLRALQALWNAGAPITAVDILPDPAIRTELSAISYWPTIPQVFVKGELLGGADITEELFASGELGRKLDDALGADRERVVKTVVMAATAA